MRHLLLLWALSAPLYAQSLRLSGLPDGAAQEQIILQDDLGQPLLNTLLPHHAQQQLPNLPVAARTLYIRQLANDGAALNEFVTQLDLQRNPDPVLNCPAFVPNQEIAQRFVFFGCNRVAAKQAAGNPSTANRAQLTADFQEIARMSPAPSYLFFTGDLVLNEVAGNVTLQNQLNAWVREYEAGPLAGSPVKLVAMTGNHEVLVQTGDRDETELPNPSTLPVWQQTMAAYIRGSNGPSNAPPNEDHLTQDQSQLSYTFTQDNLGFMVLNTDTFTTANINSQVPLNWTDHQLDALQQDPNVEHIFVLGHRPINSLDPDENAIHPAHGRSLLDQLQFHHKVRGYLCAHAHHWNFQRLEGFPQVTAGNGGSKPEKNFARHGYYGYTVVQLSRSGGVFIESWGRPIPDPYDSPNPQPAATLRERFSL